MNVDERIVVQDLGMVGRDKTHAAHVSSQGVDLIYAARGLKTILPTPKIQLQKLIGVGRVERGVLKIHPSDPIPLARKIGDQVVTDKAPGSGDDNLTVCDIGIPLYGELTFSPTRVTLKNATGHGDGCLSQTGRTPGCEIRYVGRNPTAGHSPK